MPGQQGYVFNKAGLGYNTKGQQQLYENFFASTKSCSTPFITCFYCGKTHHMHLLATWERIIVWKEEKYGFPRVLHLNLALKNLRKSVYLEPKVKSILCVLEGQMLKLVPIVAASSTWLQITPKALANTFLNDGEMKIKNKEQSEKEVWQQKDPRNIDMSKNRNF